MVLGGHLDISHNKEISENILSTNGERLCELLLIQKPDTRFTAIKAIIKASSLISRGKKNPPSSRNRFALKTFFFVARQNEARHLTWPESRSGAVAK